MQMIACASARVPGKADNSPFPELFALRRIVSRQMCVKRFKAVGMPYDNAPMERWWNEFKLRWIDRHAKPVTYKELVALVEEGINYFNQLDRSPARNDLTPAEYWNEAV